MHGKKFLILGLVLAVVTLWAPTGQTATVLFSDNFDLANGGVGSTNYNGFANWTITAGTVDLIGNAYYDYRPGNGLYVDLDGSTNNAGLMTANAISLPGAGSYNLVFDLSGSSLSASLSDTVVVKVLASDQSTVLATQTYTVAYTQGFNTYTLPFTVSGATNIYLSFDDQGTDNMGALLDRVQVAAVPLPPTALLLGSGLLGLVMAIRRRTTKV